jgi:hypothetical protein
LLALQRPPERCPPPSAPRPRRWPPSSPSPRRKRDSASTTRPYVQRNRPKCSTNEAKCPLNEAKCFQATFLGDIAITSQKVLLCENDPSYCPINQAECSSNVPRMFQSPDPGVGEWHLYICKTDCHDQYLPTVGL